MSPLVRSASLHGYEALARSLGVDVRAELRRVKLTLAQINDPDTLLPYTAMIQLLEHTAEVAACSDFGLRLSRSQNLDILGPVSVVVRHAKTFGDALQLASQYLFVHSPGARFATLPVAGQSSQVDLSFSIEIPDLPICAQTLELSLGIVAQGIRLLGQGRIRPTMAQLPHTRVGPLSSYSAVYECECRFEMPLAALRIPAASLQQPLADHNPLLQQLAQSYLDQNFGSATPQMADQVRMRVRRLLGTGQASQTAIAELMAVHPRTLQRRLKEEGVRFEDIVDGVRREQLLHLFNQAHIPTMSQVAAMLGYSEQAALTRSCRRWFGMSPSELRRSTSRSR